MAKTSKIGALMDKMGAKFASSKPKSGKMCKMCGKSPCRCK